MIQQKQRLNGVHPKLVAVVEYAGNNFDCFTVSEGLRTIERQKELLAAGKSTTMNSKHIKQADGFGHAVDLYPIKNGAIDSNGYDNLAKVLKSSAAKLGITIEWGGDWKSFIDKPHYQIKL